MSARPSADGVNADATLPPLGPFAVTEDDTKARWSDLVVIASVAIILSLVGLLALVSAAAELAK